MSKVTVVDIIETLPTLSEFELTQIRIKADFYIKWGANPTSKNAPSFIEEILVMAAQKYVSVAPLSVLKEHNMQKMGDYFYDICVQLEQLRKEWDLNRSQLFKLTLIVIEAMVEKLRAKNLDVSFKLLLYSLTDIRSILDEAFPDYIQSGLFKEYLLT